jgi:hypothetical protein
VLCHTTNHRGNNPQGKHKEEEKSGEEKVSGMLLLNKRASQGIIRSRMHILTKNIGNLSLIYLSYYIV